MRQQLGLAPAANADAVRKQDLPAFDVLVTADFGAVPATDRSFAIADAAALTTSLIACGPVADAANNLQMDAFSVAANCVVNGTVSLNVVCASGTVCGQRKFWYRIQ